MVNNVNLADLSLRYNYSPRLSVSLGVPYLMATRDGALRNSRREVVRRYERSSTDGIGDITLVGNIWLSTRRSTTRQRLGRPRREAADRRLQAEGNHACAGERRRGAEHRHRRLFGAAGRWRLRHHSRGGRFPAARPGRRGGLLRQRRPTSSRRRPPTGWIVRARRSAKKRFRSPTNMWRRLGVQFGPASWKGFSARGRRPHRRHSGLRRFRLVQRPPPARLHGLDRAFVLVDQRACIRCRCRCPGRSSATACAACRTACAAAMATRRSPTT